MLTIAWNPLIALMGDTWAVVGQQTRVSAWHWMMNHEVHLDMEGAMLTARPECFSTPSPSVLGGSGRPLLFLTGCTVCPALLPTC